MKNNHGDGMNLTDKENKIPYCNNTVSSTCSEIKNGEVLYNGSITDITESSEKYKKQLDEALKKAEAADNAKVAFLFNMSHDLRTPMNAIIGFAELAQKHLDDSDKVKDYLHKILNSGNILMSILNSILEMAMLEGNPAAADDKAWRAEQICDTLYSAFRSQMEQKGIEFTRTINVRHNCIYCDDIKLREIFMNILSNAYKYTESGGKIGMQLEELPSDREGYAVYRTKISDTGIGMSKEFTEHIFDAFARERNSEKNRIEGAGLGMAIVKRLVGLMDGTVEVESELGKGTVFTVTIPHRIASEENAADESATADIQADFTGKRVLLAEDNDLNAEIAVEILSEFGFTAERAEDGQVCIDMLKSRPADYYNIILMDIQMPNMNGYDAARAIRELDDEERANIPISAMTANTFEQDKREAIAAGMNGHIGKPIVTQDLIGILGQLLK